MPPNERIRPSLAVSMLRLEQNREWTITTVPKDVTAEELAEAATALANAAARRANPQPEE